MAFTEEVKDDPALSSICNRIVLFPKTLKMPKDVYDVGFNEREGIAFGDSAKFLNEKITATTVK